MNRVRALIAVAVLALAQGACSVSGPGEQQTLVDRATLSVQDMMTQTVSDGPRNLLRNAKAVMVCPRIFKAGFFFGGEGGNCVLLARAGNDTWSYPAFYTIGSGSFGFQFGIEDNQLFMLVMTSRGLNAVLDSQIKLGANAGIAIATLGAGVQGSTTAAVGADIVAFSASRGLFGGVALEGSVMSADTPADQAYYRQPLDSRQLVKQMQGANPGADPLRELLTRYGVRRAAYPQPPQAQPGYSPPYPPYQPPAGYAPQQTPSATGAGFAPPPAGGQGYAPPAGGQGYAPPAGGRAYAPPAASDGRGPIQEQSLAPPR